MSTDGKGLETLKDMDPSNPAAGWEVWSKEEVLRTWPQAEAELRSFMRALQRRNMNITAAQIGMALQLAIVEFERLKSES